MSNNKAKALAIIFVLFLITGLTTVGCKQKTKDTWVNTKSLPGNTFVDHSASNTKQGASTIVYLGSDSKKESSSDGFGPRDINFDFKTLR